MGRIAEKDIQDSSSTQTEGPVVLNSVEEAAEWLSRSSTHLLLTRMAHRLTSSKDKGEDLIQESSLALVDHILKGKQVDTPKAWMNRTMQNKAIDRARHDRLLPCESIDDENNAGLINDVLLQNSEGPALTPTEDAANNEMVWSLAVQALEQLPIRRKQAFVLRHIYGYTQKEIQNRMKCAENTVEQHLQKGRMDLEETLSPLRSETTGVKTRRRKFEYHH